MKNKIINAINKGLMNVLSTDIEDSNIDFDGPVIDNEYAIQDINIVKQYMDRGDDIFKLNTAGCLTLILDDGSEIPLRDYEKAKDDGHEVVFINMKACKANGFCDILLHINLKIDSQPFLMSAYVCDMTAKGFDNSECITFIPDSEELTNDFNGYRHTYYNRDIMTNNRPKNYYKAFEYCKNIKTLPGYKGYMPSSGQMKFLMKYFMLINFLVLNITDNNDLEYLHTTDNYWTSTENSYSYTIVASWPVLQSAHKVYADAKVLPVFIRKA